MSSSPASPVYYEKGSVELAVETPVMMRRLEKRRHLTENSERLLIVLVGLPARGKSFVARKLLNYLTWRGNKCQIFNVGKYRRQAATELSHEEHDHYNDVGGKRQKIGACDAQFFDDSNQAAARLRQKVAEVALRDTLEWLEDVHGENAGLPRHSSAESLGSLDASPGFANGHTSHSSRRQTQRIAIFDATNSTKERRKWILQECAKANELSGKRTGVVFVESICDDKELLAENFNFKISSCPDFSDMTKEEALEDLQARVEKYESRYEPVDDTSQSFIKIFNLSSRLMVNHIYGRLAKVVVPALMAWNTGSRPIFLCRAGATKAMQPSHPKKTRLRGDRLGEGGLRFRDALCDFVEKEAHEFMNRKNANVIHPSNMDTGTSISGLRKERDHLFEGAEEDTFLPFPCLVMSSTMPRALETASWKHPFPVKDVSNLNPLDMGDFAGMDLAGIRELHPDWYEQLSREPFHTRFPGGESYSDLINRLESVVIDMEQQLGPAVVVSHVSVLQVLISYFRSTPVASCTSIEVPMHTVLKFVPLRGGGWLESHHPLLPDEVANENDVSMDTPPSIKEPIWGDSRSCLPPSLAVPSIVSPE